MNWSSGSGEDLARAKPAVEVLVAAKDLPAGTILVSGHFHWQAWPDESLNRDYLVRRDGKDIDHNLTGAAVNRAIGAGEPFSKAMALIQAERYGTSLGVILRVPASACR